MLMFYTVYRKSYTKLIPLRDEKKKSTISIAANQQKTFLSGQLDYFIQKGFLSEEMLYLYSSINDIEISIISV
jgi:hypothetical protein